MQIHKYAKKDKMGAVLPPPKHPPVQRTKEVKTKQGADCLLLLLVAERKLTFTN